MSPSGRRFTWVPPQRHPGESTRHYVAVLSRQMRALEKVWDNEHNHHDLRQRSKNRWLKCKDLRDAAELGEK